MADEVEDGEIRSPECDMPIPEKVLENERSSHEDPLKASVHEPSPGLEILENERSLHGVHGEMHGDYSNSKEFNVNNEDNNDLEAEEVIGGPYVHEER
ncbi:hypothetical protein Hanom_Chr00s000005g01612251 [Helianthus anomalus]